MIMEVAERKRIETPLRLAAVAFEPAEAMFVTDQKGKKRFAAWPITIR